MLGYVDTAMNYYDGHKVYMNGNYPAIFLNGKTMHVHRVEWEKYNGVIPDGYIIHHRDGNKMNWKIDNLQMLSRCEHIKKHAKKVHRKGIPIIAMKDKTVMTFGSIEDAAHYCGTYESCIHRILRGKQYSSNGWKFMRVGD